MSKKKKIFYSVLGSLITTTLITAPLVLTSCSDTESTNVQQDSSQDNLPVSEPTPEPQPVEPTTAELINQDISKYIKKITNEFYTDSIIKELRSYLNEKYSWYFKTEVIVIEYSLVTDATTTPKQYKISLCFKYPTDCQLDNFYFSQPNIARSTIGFKTSIKTGITVASQQPGYSQQAIYYKQEVRRHKRTPNRNTYSTSLESEYGRYGFKYPGWNCNYEASDSAVPNGYLNVGGNQVDISQKVLDERIQFGNEAVTYSNQYFIKNEIKRGWLKKHPAANNFYEVNVADNTQAVDTKFTIDTAMGGVIPLGLYIPAGEVGVLKFDRRTFSWMLENNTSIAIHINDNYWDNKERGNSGQISNRYPYVETVFDVDLNEVKANPDREFKFGSPFGGSVSIEFYSEYYGDIPSGFSNGEPITFEVDNCVESLNYIDGFTTQQSWDRQIQDVKNGNITSPIIDIAASLYTAHLPFTNTRTKECSGIGIDSFVYPKEVCRKWNDFLYLSNAFADDGNPRRLIALDMKFCDDIWNDAGALGGGMKFYCPISWGADSFLHGGDPVNMSNWGTIHEINHSFEQNKAFFNQQAHGQTNTVSIFDLSVMSDVGKYRNEVNINDDIVSKDIYHNMGSLGWNRFSSPFNTVRCLDPRYNGGSESEWGWYAAVIYMLGPKNFYDFVKDNQREYPNDLPNWTPMKFIKYWSEYFKTNYWYLCEKAPQWYGVDNSKRWPLYPDGNDQQIIDRLTKLFPAVDFVANLYACGQYIYDFEEGVFNYTSDVTTPYQIPAFEPYTFQFDKYIVSNNPDFQWKYFTTNQTTKLGGSLRQDPTNRKNLIYTPNPNAVDQVDEFNLVITPDEFPNRPKSYVPAYKFKIKVRQVVNKPIIKSYYPTSDSSPVRMLDNFDWDGRSRRYRTFSTNPLFALDKSNALDASDGSRRIAKVEFNYVVPEDGRYDFIANWDDAIKVGIDSQVFKYGTCNGPYKIATQDWKKGQVVKFQIALVAPTSKDGKLDFHIRKSGVSSKVQDKYDIFNNCVVPSVDTSNTKAKIIQSYVSNDLFKYHSRTIDYSLYSSTTKRVKMDFDNVIDDEIYNFYDPKNKYIPNLKKDVSSPYVDDTVQTSPDGQYKYTCMEFTAKFTEPTTVSALQLEIPQADQRYSPTHFQTTVVTYDSQYFYNDVVENKQSSQTYQILDLGKTYQNVKMIKFKFYRGGLAKYNKTKVVIGRLKFLKNYVQQNLDEMWAFNNSKIDLDGWLEYYSNDFSNLSNLNGMYLKSRARGDTITFTLHNTSLFNIIGRTSSEDGTFNLYINDELVLENVNCNSSKLKMNQMLCYYKNPNPKKDIVVKIVNTSDKTLVFNSILTYGRNTNLI